MRYRPIFIILLFCFSSGMTYGQDELNNTSEILQNLFGRLINNYDDIDRTRINDSIDLLIDSYARSDTVLNHRFSNLKYLGQVTSSDSLLKIITWNLVLTRNPGRYYSYFIRKMGPGKQNKVSKLTKSYQEESIRTDTIYTESNWYGALYYEVKPYSIDGTYLYILLGIDFSNISISRKLIDVLSFTRDDSIIFGRKWFEDGDKLNYRAVFEYASNGMMSLRFSSKTSIVFDHLVPFSPSMKDDRQFYGPDYSTDAYNFEDGLWKMKINVDARNIE